MTKAELKRIEELERRIKELEARPPVVHWHYLYPQMPVPTYPPYQPTYPWWQVTSTGTCPGATITSTCD